MPADGLSGVALAQRGGVTVAEHVGGMADRDLGLACTAQTRFQIASVSKQFAAVAALLLAESGRLDLAEPVARWLPGGPPQWQQVTLGHLLAHTAGERFQSQVQCNADPQTYIHEDVLVVRNREIYRLHLQTVPERYAADVKLLDAMVRSWRWRAMR